MKPVLALLDKARDVCGSDAELCRSTGIPTSHPAQWRAGTRKVNAEMVGLLADVVGLPAEDAQRMALLAVVDCAKDAKKQGVLRRVFFAFLEPSGQLGGKPKTLTPAAPLTDDLTERALVQLEPEHDIHWRGLRSGWERAALLLRGALNVILPARPACS